MLGKAIVPGACLFELAGATLHMCGNIAADAMLSSCSITSPMMLEDGGGGASTCYVEVLLSAGRVELSSSSSMAQSPIIHVSSAVQSAPATAPPRVEGTSTDARGGAEARRCRVTGPVACVHVYGQLRAQGLEYGKDFQVLVSVRSPPAGETAPIIRAIGTMDRPGSDVTSGNGSRRWAHPAYLTFQLCS